MGTNQPPSPKQFAAPYPFGQSDTSVLSKVQPTPTLQNQYFPGMDTIQQQPQSAASTTPSPTTLAKPTIPDSLRGNFLGSWKWMQDNGILG